MQEKESFQQPTYTSNSLNTQNYSETAIKYINKAIEIDDSQAVFYLNLANAYQQTSDFTIAEELYNKAISKEVFGGEFKLEKLTSLERFVVVKVAGVTKDFTRLNEENIIKTADIINRFK